MRDKTSPILLFFSTTWEKIKRDISTFSVKKMLKRNEHRAGIG